MRFMWRLALRVRSRKSLRAAVGAALGKWFPDGLDSPELALLRVSVATAEYWDAPASRVKKLVGGLRAAVTGDPGKFPGTNQTVELDQP